MVVVGFVVVQQLRGMQQQEQRPTELKWEGRRQRGSTHRLKVAHSATATVAVVLPQVEMWKKKGVDRENEIPKPSFVSLLFSSLLSYRIAWCALVVVVVVIIIIQRADSIVSGWVGFEREKSLRKAGCGGRRQCPLSW